MAQLTTIAAKVDAYESDTEEIDEQAEIKIHNTLSTSDDFNKFGDDIDLFFATVQYQAHIDEVIAELNARETATIDGGSMPAGLFGI